MSAFIGNLSDDEGEDLPESYPSCWHSITQAILDYPAHIALVSTHQVSDLYGILSDPLDSVTYAKQPYLRWTYTALKHAANRLASGLAAQGAVPGVVVFTFLHNCAEFVLIQWAVWSLGCTLVPLNPRNVVNRTELSHMLSTASTGSALSSAIVVAADCDLAHQLEDYALLAKAVKILVEPKPRQGWLAFADLMAMHSLTGSPSNGFSQDSSTDDMVLFTSGTTDLPKGCRLNHPHGLSSWQAILAAGKEQIQAARARAGSVCAVVAPNNHLMWYLATVLAHCVGATVVFPGASFEPREFFAAASSESVTHFIAAPTMIHALVGAQTESSTRLSSLQTVALGGAGVTAQVARLCTDKLGARDVEVLGGMTEQAVFTSGQVNASGLPDADTMSIGRCLPGCRVKICVPERTTPVPLNTPGELHFSGPGLIEGYMGHSSSPNFYLEDGTRWIATGDMVRMDSERNIYVIGRYKEMIIRGGVNISPTAIEACIARELPRLESLQVQVVGLKDEIAGEVPIAVARKRLQQETVDMIRETITRHMGKIYALADVVCLDELGVSEYPRTILGKVQKSKLAELINNRASAAQANAATNVSFARKVARIIAQVTGTSLSTITMSTELSELADSITLMRLVNALNKGLKVHLTSAKMSEADTVGTLVRQLKLESNSNNSLAVEPRLTGHRSPTEDDMVFLRDNTSFEVVKHAVERTVSAYDLKWDDVAAVFPAYDFTRILVKNHFLDKLSFKILILARAHSVEVRSLAYIGSSSNSIS